MFALLLAADPTPTPTMTVPAEAVTPGTAGFIAIAAVGIAAILLIVDMTRRVRRVRYREEVNAELDAEEAAAEQTGDDLTPPDSPQ
ncbi:MAG: hypothetical protein QM607_08675 [Microbacterium sp.]